MASPSPPIQLMRGAGSPAPGWISSLSPAMPTECSWSERVRPQGRSAPSGPIDSRATPSGDDGATLIVSGVNESTPVWSTTTHSPTTPAVGETDRISEARNTMIPPRRMLTQVGMVLRNRVPMTILHMAPASSGPEAMTWSCLGCTSAAPVPSTSYDFHSPRRVTGPTTAAAAIHVAVGPSPWNAIASAASRVAAIQTTLVAKSQRGILIGINARRRGVYTPRGDGRFGAATSPGKRSGIPVPWR